MRANVDAQLNCEIQDTTKRLRGQEYSTRRTNEVMPLAATWVGLEMLILNEVRERKANTI